MKIGFSGLGQGQRIAHNLSRADGELIVHDVKRNALADLEKHRRAMADPGATVLAGDQ
jgi:3-hydroxyisobutyrate dehydrogenase-like beta-hydroxyacid dehydrogenase